MKFATKSLIGLVLAAAVLGQGGASLAAEPTRVAVFNIQAKAGVGQEVGDSLTEEMLARLRKTPDIHFSAMNEVQAALDLEQKKQLLGCAEDACLVEIAGAMGVDYLVTGTVSVMGDNYALSVKLVDAHSGQAVAQAYERFRSQAGEELFDAAEKAARQIVLALSTTQKPGVAAHFSTPSEPPVAPQPAVAVTEPEKPGTSPWVWVMTGVAVAGLGAGIAGTVIHSAASSDYDAARKKGYVTQKERDDIDSRGGLGGVMAIAGYSAAGLGAAGALMIYFLSDSGGGQPKAVSAAPMILPMGCGVAVAGGF